MKPERPNLFPNVRDIAIIGSGRWVRQIAGVLALIFSRRNITIILCSETNLSAWEEWRDTQTEQHPSFRFSSSIDETLNEESVTHVFIARKARYHSQNAIEALKHGKAVFVEKPFALTHKQALDVSKLAETSPCVTGTTLLYAPNLLDFIENTCSLGTIAEINIHWADAIRENRYGETKSYDSSLNVIQDVFLHVWSLIQLLKTEYNLKLLQTHVECGGRIVEVVLEADDAKVFARMERDSENRKRLIAIKGTEGDAICDFTTEPGTAIVGGSVADISQNFSSPLQIHIERFLSEPLKARSTLPSAVHNTLSAQKIVDKAVEFIRSKQRALLREYERSEGSTPSDDLIYADRELELSKAPSPSTDS